MKIINKFPPNYQQIAKTFDLTGLKPIFCYGDTIYNPHKGTITPDLMAHEAVHERQQREFGSIDAWWKKYLTEPAFRLSQELQAYRVQYAYAQKHTNRSVAWQILQRISVDLAGPLYGNMMTVPEAREMITSNQ